MKKIRIVICCVLLMAICVSLGACSSQESENKGEIKTALTTARSKDIGDLNGHLYAGDMAAQAMVFDTLVENTIDGPKAALAESWDISKDGTVYTFHLRKGVNFTDGQPFNAAAVKANIDAVQRNPEKHAWISLSKKIKSVDIVDDNTVNIVLSEPYYPILTELGLLRPYCMMSPATFINGETKDGVSAFVGTGPYKLTEHVQNQYATFVSNDEYWGGEPKIKTVTFKVLPAGQTAQLALQNGEIDFLYSNYSDAMLDSETLKSLETNKDYQIVYSEPCATRFLMVNASKPETIIADKNIKEAIWYGINKEELSSEILSGLEKPAETLFPSTAPYCDVKLKERKFDTAKAKKLIEASGWKMESGSEYYTKNGEKLSVRIEYRTDVAGVKGICEYLQSNLKDIGVELILIGEEKSAYYDRRKTGDYDLLIDATWGVPYDPQSTMSAFSAPSSYLTSTQNLENSQEMFDWINQALVSTDEVKRQELYTKVLNKIQDDACFIPLTDVQVIAVAPKDLKNITFNQSQYEIPFEKMYFE